MPWMIDQLQAEAKRKYRRMVMVDRVCLLVQILDLDNRKFPRKRWVRSFERL
jgi:hypothetical protein